MFKNANNSRGLETKTNKKNGVSQKCMKTSKIKMLTLFVLCATFSAGFSSCSNYDEQDGTIIAYLKINDLLEKKLAKTCNSEIEKVHKELGKINDVSSVNIQEAFVRYGGYNVDYDFDCIRTFIKKYKISKSAEVYNIKQLEMDISVELWNYLNLTYSEVIPSKAQNTEEGRYYSIAELKAKYPDYKEVEIENFRPMELVNSVMSEKLFNLPAISESNVNLRTLYVYYLANRKVADDTKTDKSVSISPNSKTETMSKIDYVGIIKTHFPNGISDEVNVDNVKTTFQKLSSGKDPMYTNDTPGFENFANDYFETDMFSGEDVEQ